VCPSMAVIAARHADIRPDCRSALATSVSHPYVRFKSRGNNCPMSSQAESLTREVLAEFVESVTFHNAENARLAGVADVSVMLSGQPLVTRSRHTLCPRSAVNTDSASGPITDSASVPIID
jgi:hypothetical protein